MALPPPTAPLPLAVAIVCKNNEATIERTLESVRDLVAGGGEIVAIDSGSTDRTIPILESFGARVIRSEWLGHVKTKQKALDAFQRAWVLSLDSDESLEPDLQRSVREVLLKNDHSVQGYTLNRKVFYNGRFLHHAWQPERRLRQVGRQSPCLVKCGGRRLDQVPPELQRDFVRIGTISSVNDNGRGCSRPRTSTETCATSAPFGGVITISVRPSAFGRTTPRSSIVAIAESRTWQAATLVRSISEPSSR